MRKDDIDLVLQAASRLLPEEGGAKKIRSLPIERATGRYDGFTMMELPQWAADLVPQGRTGLLVPLWTDQKHADWKTYDWWRAAKYHLNSDWERAFEKQNGPIHSYAYRLGDQPRLCFEHAWVNRIILFMRRWWAQHHQLDEGENFGPIPVPILHLTHDVDAVEKTVAIRLKQCVFCLYNLRFGAALRFLFGRADYWQFETILAMEGQSQRTSLWNIYGGVSGWRRSLKQNLMDPSYDIAAPRLKAMLHNLLALGHRIGLHQAYDSWADSDHMRTEKQAIETVIGQTVSQCRQHWLRFSFSQTWAAQKQAGLVQDMTLGFNDRCGFRNAAALSFTDVDSGMEVIPMVLMDSHLYDYNRQTQSQREEMIDSILQELKETGGEASVIWHHRVFHPDYRWGEGYQYLLNKMDEMGFEKR